MGAGSLKLFFPIRAAQAAAPFWASISANQSSILTNKHENVDL
jgi:hypothetical protein